VDIQETTRTLLSKRVSVLLRWTELSSHLSSQPYHRRKVYRVLQIVERSTVHLILSPELVVRLQLLVRQNLDVLITKSVELCPIVGVPTLLAAAKQLALRLAPPREDPDVAAGPQPVPYKAWLGSLYISRGSRSLARRRDRIVMCWMSTRRMPPTSLPAVLRGS
jgi:hypothetical protein